jgi:hypothetical protein
MIDLMERADPAIGLETDMSRLRSKVNERIGLSPPLRPSPEHSRRPWLIAVAAFAAVIVAFLPVVLREEPRWVFAPQFGGTLDLPGVDGVVPLASGGVQTQAVDGDTIWVMTALQNELQRISALTGDVETTYSINGYVEGVVVGSGYVWLMSYDNGGQVLRFDPVTGAVDTVIPIGGLPGGAAWFGGSLWISNDQGQLHQVSVNGQIASTRPGELKGEGLGYLWVNDPATGLISSLAENGTRGEIMIPTETGKATSDGWGVRSVAEAGGYLWLMDGDFPWGTNLSKFDLDTGELAPLSITFGLLGMTEFDGSLWVTSHTDHLLIRVNPESGELHRYPMPGKAGGVFVADGSLWVSLYHPGVIVRLDPSGLIEAGEIVADDWNGYPHRLLCTGGEQAQGPTIILEPNDWIEYGSWSVVQAQLSQQGYVVCANGYLRDEASPAQRAADLEQALIAEGITGPYVLVATGDGVHTARLFADGRTDIAGVVLVDPMPVGFQTFLDTLIAEIGAEAGHPPWLDLEPTVSDSLDNFGDLPLVVIGQDPQAMYLNPRFAAFAGEDTAASINAYWQDGLAFYADLSTDSRSEVADGTGDFMVLWDRPDLVVQAVLDVFAQAER